MPYDRCTAHTKSTGSTTHEVPARHQHGADHPRHRHVSPSRKHTLEMVQMADQGGFHIAWAAEHHAIEMTIAPTFSRSAPGGPRTPTASASASRWRSRPIGIRSNSPAPPRSSISIRTAAPDSELAPVPTSANSTGCIPGLKQSDGWRYMQEALPVIKALWAGDVEHKGEFWAVSTLDLRAPKPVQLPSSPRSGSRPARPSPTTSPSQQGCNILSWPLTRPMSEAELYKSRLDEAMQEASGCQAADLRDDAAHLRL